MPSLHSLQAWMLSVITDPRGVAAGAGAPAASDHLELAGNRPEQVVCATPTWGAADRLSVYWNAYFARLQECLRDEFPVLRQTVGDAAFDEFVAHYLQAFPPSSYTLGRLGARFAEFLAGTRPPRTFDDGTPDWADFLVDLAGFEWTLAEVFDGPGAEHLPPFATASLEGLAGDRFERAVLECAPSLRLCRYRFPVQRYHFAVRAGEQPGRPEAETTFVAVTRRDFTVRHDGLQPTEFALLSALQAAQTLGAALVALCAVDECAEREISAHIAEWFSAWTRAGYFVDVHS